jgi:ribosomal-protein-alanine N-acetyltransferase
MQRFGVSEFATEEGRGPEPGAIQLRRLSYSDLPSVLAIERRSFQAPWSLAMFVLELSKPSGVCLAASDSEGLVGYLICSRYADVWHLMNVATAPERRRLGIATRLIEAMFAEAGRDSRYTLEVRASNRGAIAMYERFGFRPAGHRRRYYHDNGEDALIMWLERQPVGS